MRRSIGGTGLNDIIGPYPWAGFTRWWAVGSDLDLIADAVSATVVISPTSDVGNTVLREQFPDHLVDFKSHYLVDLTTNYYNSFSTSHRRKLRGCRPELTIEVLGLSPSIESRWIDLYKVLGNRHGIKGDAAFTKDGLIAQLRLPSVTVFGATLKGRVVGMVSFIRSGSVAAYHLGAYDDTGYEVGASYAAFCYAFGVLADTGVEVVNLGGGAGLTVDDNDGLARFKRGWSTHTGVARIGGRILDPVAFGGLQSPSSTSFWPPYRAGQSS